MIKSTKQKGFTLIELMVVVAVVGVLGAIALPMYNESVRKSRRTAVKAQLQEIAQNMERWFTLRNTYAGFTLGAFSASPVGEDPGKAFYLVEFAAAPTATAWQLRATPSNAQYPDRCGVYTLNQAGQKTADQPDCW